MVERRPDPILAGKDTTARKHMGKEFPWRSPEGSVTLVIEVEKAEGEVRLTPIHPHALALITTAHR